MDVIRQPMQWVQDHPRAADWLLAALALAIALPLAANSEIVGNQRAIGGLGWTLLVAMNLPLAWRRTAPIAAVWATVLLTAPYWVIDFPDDAAGPNLLILVYSLAAHGARPRAIRHFLLAVGLLTSVLAAGVISTEDDLPWVAVPANLVIFGTAWILGDNLRTRRQYLAELEEKASRTEEQQIAESRRAVAEERTRIARELHDVVAHSMSVMVVQAGAARSVLARNPQQATSALEAIETTGRESLDEMRRVLGVLRGDDESAALAPAPGLGDFSRLLQSCEDAGLPVELEVEGDARRLAPGLEMNAYRIVQESLTNSLKHAGPAAATVRLRYLDAALEVSVTDDGRGAAADAYLAGSGQGIIGMRERVEVYGGSLTVGPRPGGGYSVVARFPLGTS
ncbi:MAG: signal transduction histidine kinase [Candidatus Aldehydirespiratoraceae bacterium]|jgi:signal transduction histidine kinase